MSNILPTIDFSLSLLTSIRTHRLAELRPRAVCLETIAEVYYQFLMKTNKKPEILPGGTVFIFELHGYNGAQSSANAFGRYKNPIEKHGITR